MKKRKHKITQDVFNGVKLLQKAGLGTTKASKAVGIGGSTACYIFRLDTLEEYRQFMKNMSDKQREKVAASKEQPKEKPSHQVSILVDALNQQSEQVAKLSEIIKSLENKKGLFR